MARVATASTLSPGLFSTGNYIRTEDMQAVQEQLNYTFQNIRRNSLYVIGAPDGWGSSTNEVAPHGVLLPNTTGTEVIYRWEQWIDPDSEAYSLALLIDPTGSDEFEASIALGAYTTSFSTFVNGGGVQSESADVATIGTGLVSGVLTVEHTVGTTDTYIDYFYSLEETPTIPAPPDE